MRFFAAPLLLLLALSAAVEGVPPTTLREAAAALAALDRAALRLRLDCYNDTVGDAMSGAVLRVQAAVGGLYLRAMECAVPHCGWEEGARTRGALCEQAESFWALWSDMAAALLALQAPAPRSPNEIYPGAHSLDECRAAAFAARVASARDWSAVYDGAVSKQAALHAARAWHCAHNA